MDERLWTDLAESFDQFRDSERRLVAPDFAQGLALIEQALHRTRDREAALAVIQRLPYRDRVRYLDQILYLLSNTVRETQACRDILLSTPKALVHDPIIERIDRLLPTADAEAYRRFAELLRAMGSPYLGRLVSMARASIDPETREVAADFYAGPEDGPNRQGPAPA